MAKTDVEIPDSYDGIDDWATDAVRGANNWLITLRNATDEGIDPWSDQFTDDENGIMTYSEGLIALSLIGQNAPVEHDSWRTLRSRYLQEDMKDILDEINAEDGPRFKTDPYLPELGTHNFTVAATFSISAIVEVLSSGVELGDNIDEEEIESALDVGINWLLDNKIEEVETENAAGWSWVGKTSSAYGGYEQPENYFTYSAVIVLCDLLNTRDDIDVIDAAVSGYEDEIVETLKQSNNFLQYEYWDGDYWSVYTRPGEAIKDSQNLLSTCYSFIGQSYIEYVVDEIAIEKEQRKKMGTAMNWILNFYENNPNIWATTINYRCGDDSEFVDGSAPYVVLDALTELVNFREDVLDYIDDFSRDEILEVANERLAPAILDRCWAGDEKYSEKGFRHIQRSDLLLNNPDGAPKTNPTAIYSTGVAIETFLLNFLDGGDDITHDESTTEAETETQTEADVTPDQEPTVSAGKTVNNIIIDGKDNEYPSEIDEQLQNIQASVEQITEDIQNGADKTTDSGISERNYEFIQEYEEFKDTLNEEYTDNWKVVIQNLGDEKGSISSSLQRNWETKFKLKQVEQFPQFLLELYFCPTRETFEEEVIIDEKEAAFLLPPQRQIYDEIIDWEDERFKDVDGRRNYVESAMANLEENPWGNEDLKDLIHQFGKRYNEEVMN